MTSIRKTRVDKSGFPWYTRVREREMDVFDKMVCVGLTMILVSLCAIMLNKGPVELDPLPEPCPARDYRPVAPSCDGAFIYLERCDALLRL